MYGIKDLRTDGFIGYAFKTIEDAKKYKDFLLTLGWEDDVLSIEDFILVDNVDELINEVR